MTETRLMVLFSSWSNWNQRWAIELVLYKRAIGYRDRTFRGVWKSPKRSPALAWQAVTEGAALQKAHKWLRSVGAEEVE